MNIITLYRWLPLSILILVLILFFYFHLYNYVSFASLKAHHELLLHWNQQHYSLSVLIFISLYIVSIACSIPAVTILSLVGGMLFGTILGTLYIVMSATLGASLFILIVRTAIHNWMTVKNIKWLQQMQTGFQKNAFSYLLVLRLLPIFPFWMVNIVAAILNVRLKIFALATFIGIIPISFIHALIGTSLGNLLANDTPPTLATFLTPPILLPLLALALLVIAPVIYKLWQTRQKGNINSS